MVGKIKTNYLIALILFGAMSLTFRPGIWLIHKPPNHTNAFYVRGWEDGCVSGTNSYSLLFAPLLEHPFIKDIDAGVKTDAPAHPAKPDATPVNSDKDTYKGAWNEGFTLCRFYQSSVYELMQFVIIIVTLLYIGCLLARKKD